jgi:hypothetical protein
MAAMKGFFSIVQFCPDLDRGECVNVGAVLVVPEVSFLGVQFSDDNEGPKQRFGKDAFDDARLAVSKQALKSRLERDGAAWRGPEDLLSFGRKEGNHLLLSSPRVILVKDPTAELNELFQRLVYVEPRQRRRSAKVDLKSVFETKLVGVPLQRNLTVSIPEFGNFEIPYAYRNGRLNLIKPEGFPVDQHNAEDRANELAVTGHLLAKHPDEAGVERRLVVVGSFEASTSDALKHRIEFVLKEHEARFVPVDQIDSFVDEIRRDAHN